MKPKFRSGSLRLQSTIIAACSLFGGATMFAQTYTAPAAGSGGTNLWAAGTNWSAVPVSGATTELTFTGSLTSGSSSVQTNNDVVNPFVLNKFTFTASNIAATGNSPAFNIGGSALNFVSNGGTAPTIILSATGGTRKPKLTIAQNIALGADLTITTSSVDTTTTGGNSSTGAILKGSLSGNFNLNIDGPGSVFLDGAGSSFGGAGKAITVTGGGFLGWVNQGTNGMFGSTSNKIVLDGGGLLFNPTNDSTVSQSRVIELGTAGTNILRSTAQGTRGIVQSGALTGTGSFTNSGTTGPLTLSGITGASMSGTATSAASTIRVAGNGTGDALGAAKLAIGGGGFVFGGSATTATTLANFTRDIAVNTAGSLGASNNYTFTHTGALTGSATLSINGSENNNFGTFINTVRVQGSNSKIVLAGDNSGFTGSVNVTAGILQVGNTVGSTTTLTGASGKTITVANGATLGGFGVINTSTTVSAGGKLAVGASAGSMEFGANLNLGAATASTAIELGGTSFSLDTTEQYDRIKMTGTTADTLTLGGTLNVTLIDSFVLAANQAFGIVQLDGNAVRSGTFAGLAEGGSLGTLGGTEELFITYTANFGNSGSIALTGGNDIALYTVPEPSSALLVLGGLGMLLGFRRR